MKTLLSLCLAGMVLAPFAFSAGVVSTPVQQTSASAAGHSFTPTVSANGRHIVFVSHANNVVTNDDARPFLDVFRSTIHFPLTSGYPPIGVTNTVLVSVSSAGVGGANADANQPSISSNGQLIAFASRASNLVPGDNNNASDVFVRDVVNGTTRLLSLDVNGNSPVDPSPSHNVPLSASPLISGDGRWVFFESRATNLTAPGAPLSSVNIYARDTWSNVTVLVSAAADGAPLAGAAKLVGVTSDGTLIAFTTTNRLVVPGVATAGPDVYVRNLQTGATIWASTNAEARVGGAYTCDDVQISRDAHVLVFNGTAVSSGVTTPLIFDLDARTTTRITTPSPSFFITNSPLLISANGAVVGFEAQDYCCLSQVLLWNRSSNASFVVHQGQFWQPVVPLRLSAISPNGEYVVFSDASFPIATNGTPRGHQLFLKEISAGTLRLLTAQTNGEASLGSHEFSSASLEIASHPETSSQSLILAFDSVANSLVYSDVNGASDVFFRAPLWDKTYLVSAAHVQRPAASAPAQSFLTPNSLNADGTIVASLRYDDGSARETNGLLDVFVSDMSNGSSVAVSFGPDGYYTNMAGNVSYAGSTNTYRAPVVSANGTTVAATKGIGLQTGMLQSPSIAVGRTTNGSFARTRLVNVIDSGDSPSLAGDGLLLAFRTDDSSLYPGDDNNGVSDVWVTFFFPQPDWPADARKWWRPPGRNVPLSLATSRYTGNGPSIMPRMSPDDGRVAYASRAGDLIRPLSGQSQAPYATYQLIVNTFGTNRTSTDYLAYPFFSNRLCSYSAIITQTYEWIDSYDTNSFRTNVNFGFIPITTDTTASAFSGNGRYVFYGLADGSAIYRHDLSVIHTNIHFVRYDPSPPWSVVSTSIVAGATNVLVCTNCRNVSADSEGNVVAYERARSGAGIFDAFAKDMSTGEEALASINRFGVAANGSSTAPVLGGDGRYVIFQSHATDLIATDANGASDIFVRDRLLGVTMLVSATAQGLPGNGPSSRPLLAANGRTIVFQSLASDLISNDYNERRDIFVLTLANADSDGDGIDDDWEVIHFENLSRDGESDFDGDGESDRAEFLAGTDPKSDGSVFRVLTVAPVGGGSRQLIWIGNPSRSYRAEFKDDLSAPNWTPVSGTISWNGTTASITDTTATSSGQRYYRAVRLP